MDLSKRDQRIIDRIIYKEPDVETYSGEFDETYNKKWFSEKEIRLAINKVKEKEREDFRKILQVHNLHKIIKTMDLVNDRFKVVEILRQLVFKEGLKANERDHLQKVIEQNYWIFGEQYHLLSKDESFQKSLERYLYLLEGKTKKSEFTGNSADRMDIFMCRRWKSGSIKNVIVELKSPKIKKLTEKEYMQVDKYRTAIKGDHEFNSSIADWNFILVGQSYNEFIQNQIESNKHHGEPSLANKVERFKIYVKTWSQIFDEFEISHEWLNKKLQVEKDIIIQELATADEGVRKAIDSSAAHS